MDAQLIKKLRLNQFDNIQIIIPAKEEKTAFQGYSFPTSNKEKLDLAIAFVYTLEEMKEVILKLSEKQSITENGQVYLLYPKNKNKLGHPPIHRDSIFPFLEVDEEDGYVKNTEYKFNRMVALDENYTLIGTKYVSKKNVQPSNRPSASVNDYVDHVKDIAEFLKDYPAEYDFYQKLTPGYQKDWARYVYSAKTESTITKRLNEMVEILKQGYKTKQLYRQGKK